jgi:hypothetical protein
VPCVCSAASLLVLLVPASAWLLVPASAWLLVLLLLCCLCLLISLLISAFVICASVLIIASTASVMWGCGCLCVLCMSCINVAVDYY